MSMGFSKQEYWSGDTISSSQGSSLARDWTQVSCITDYLPLSHRGSPRGKGKEWGKSDKFQYLNQWSRPELDLVHSRDLGMAGWMSDYHMTSFTSLMFCDGIQLLDKWRPFLNDEMITQNVLSLPLSLSRIKKPTSMDLHGLSAKSLQSCLTLATLWTVAYQAPLSMGFSRQEYGMGCHVLLQGIFSTQRPYSHLLQLLHCRQFLYCWATGKACVRVCVRVYTDILYCFIFLCTWTPYWRKYP